jgi:cell division protein FtsQ
MKILTRNSIFLILGICSLVFLMAFANIQNNVTVKGVEPVITNNELQYFLTEQEIKDVVISLYDSIENIPIREINIGMLEDTLESLIYVENAEVFSNLDGRLSIVVNQHKAIARIFNGNKHEYLNSMGETMPLSRNHSAMVPFVTGKVKQPQLEYTHQLLMQATNDPFYEGIITGLDFSNEDILLFSALGNHKIIWGNTDNSDTKLKKLKIFYQSQEKEDVANLKTINLMYKDQVVFTN